jgi:hypothetical protein
VREAILYKPSISKKADLPKVRWHDGQQRQMSCGRKIGSAVKEWLPLVLFLLFVTSPALLLMYAVVTDVHIHMEIVRHGACQ